MRSIFVAILFFVLATTPPSGWAQEPLAKSNIVSVGVFKNGLARVQQEVEVPGPGTYRLDMAPEPVHGTFWVKSNCAVESALKLLDVDIARPVGTLQEELAGKAVVVHLKDNKATVAGTVEQGARSPMGFLVLKTAAGASYINPNDITSCEIKGAGKADEITVKQQRPALVLTVGKTDKKPAITLTYLTHGLSWAPSYLVEVADGKSLSIEMAAAVRNEFAKLQDAEVKLMTGLPAIQFAHVIAPLGPKQNIEKFLSGINADVPAVGDGIDSQFTSIGKRKLKAGETLSLSVDRAKVEYERVVEWDVASDEAGAIAEEIWDVLHFKNPFEFPMAMAPALVMDKDQIKCQRTCSRASVGEGSSLRFNRALDMRTRGQEQEDLPKKEGDKEAKPELVRIGTHEYRRATIQGEMTVKNLRAQVSKLIIRRAVKGKVLSADGEIKVLPQEEGTRTVNPSQEIVWTLNLAAGEEKTVHYRYQALILQTKERWGFSW